MPVKQKCLLTKQNTYSYQADSSSHLHIYVLFQAFAECKAAVYTSLLYPSSPDETRSVTEPRHSHLPQTGIKLWSLNHFYNNGHDVEANITPPSDAIDRSATVNFNL